MVPTDGVKKTRTSTPPPRGKITGAQVAGKDPKVLPNRSQNENLQKTGNQGKATEVKMSSWFATFKEKLRVGSRCICLVATAFTIVIAVLMIKNHVYVTEGCRQAFERLSALKVSDVSLEVSEKLNVAWTLLQRAVQTITKQSWKDVTLLPWTKIAAVFVAIIIPIGAGLRFKKPMGEKWVKVTSWFRTKRAAA